MREKTKPFILGRYIEGVADPRDKTDQTDTLRVERRSMKGGDISASTSES